MKKLTILTISIFSFLISNAQQESPKSHRFELGFGLGQSFSLSGFKAQLVFDKKIDYALYASVGSIPPYFPVGGSIGGKVYFYKHVFLGAQVGTSAMEFIRDEVWNFYLEEQVYLYGPSLYLGMDKPIGKHSILNFGAGAAYVPVYQAYLPHIDLGFSYSFKEIKK